MLIEVASVDPPKSGKKLGKVTTVTGQAFDVWPDKLTALQVGRRYNVEFTEREFNGRTYRKITKALPAVNGSKPQPPTNGHAAPIALAGAHPDPDREWLFVRELLAAGVQAGTVPFTAHDLRSATAMLRTLWRDVGR